MRPRFNPRPSLEFSEMKRGSAKFLKENIRLDKRFLFTAKRYREIHALLLEEGINKHDQGHQYRTVLNADIFMQMLGYDHENRLITGVSGSNHDVGYIRKDEKDPHNTDPSAAGKTSFKKHAVYGADEVSRWLKILTAMKKRGRHMSFLPEAARVEGVTLDDLLMVRDEGGEWIDLNEGHFRSIYDQILHHNHYGKGGREFDPHETGPLGLMVRFGDKIDVCRQRVYKEHMQNPQVFVKGSEAFDRFYFHRCVPYSTLGYEFELAEDQSSVTIKYYVDLDDFNKLMSGVERYEVYTPEDYRKDFLNAYKKSFEIVSESLGVILGDSSAETNLRIQFECKQGEIEEMVFGAAHEAVAA